EPGPVCNHHQPAGLVRKITPPLCPDAHICNFRLTLALKSRSRARLGFYTSFYAVISLPALPHPGTKSCIFQVFLVFVELFGNLSDSRQSPHLQRVSEGLRSLTRSYVLSKRLVLFLWHAVLQGQHGCRPSQQYQTKHDHPQEVEGQSVTQDRNRHRHDEWPDGDWGEETVDTRGIFNFNLYTIFEKTNFSQVNDMKVVTEHDG